MVFRRCDMGIPDELSPASRTAATIAATLLAFDELLFRRVTRWLGFSDPEPEWEWMRECDFGSDPEFVDMDNRCWPIGLEACWISCSNRDI